MAILDKEAAEAILKEDYLPGVREQLNNDVMLLAQLDKNTEDVEGLEAVLSLHIGRSGGVGSRRDGGTLPTPGKQRRVKQRVPIFFHYGVIEVSGPAIEAARSDRGSFTRPVESETEGMQNDLKRQLNRQAWGTSDGVIAVCGVTAAANDIVLAATTTERVLDQLYVGLHVDIGTVADPVLRAADREITAIDEDALEITVSGGVVTTAATDRVFVAGNGGTTDALRAEITGVQTIVDDAGTLHGVDPTVHPEWKATVDTAVENRNATERMVEKNVNRVWRKTGQNVDLLVGSEGVAGSLTNLLMSRRRTVDTLELKGGHAGVEFVTPKTRAALTWDRDTPENTLFGFTTKRLQQYVGTDWDWIDDDGGVLQRSSSRKHSFEAWLYKSNEVGTDTRGAHMKIEALIEA